MLANEYFILERERDSLISNQIRFLSWSASAISPLAIKLIEFAKLNLAINYRANNEQ